MAFAFIRPYHHVALRLPSDAIRVEQLLPNTLINLGKYGSFHTNNLFGRPYHLTFEILDRAEAREGQELRVVPAAELHATTLLEEAEAEDDSAPGMDLEEDAPPPTTTAKSNVNIVDDPLNQRLTMAEIEALKQDEMGSTKDLISKIMQSHSMLDQKTAFSLAKYTLRKQKKYHKRFCVLPLDVATLTDYMTEKDFAKIMEIRNETIGLVGCWANVHAAGNDLLDFDPSSRYLVVDDTGGLVVAALAERMGFLHNTEEDLNHTGSADEPINIEAEPPQANVPHKPKRQQYSISTNITQSNTITLVHANQQPNLALLRYFNFDASNPTPTHTLYSHLKCISWLQLLDPTSDNTYTEPAILAADELSALKSSRRSTYFRKRRRWERTKAIVDETRGGGFNALVVASYTSPASILRHLVPLMAGGSQVVVYSPHIEPLVELADLYSTARRTAFLNTPKEDRKVPSEDFPVDPTLLLVPMVQTSRVRRWQVLPGRTHPLMTGRGGAEGYVFVGTRVIPADGNVSARGRPPRAKKKTNNDNSSEATGVEDVETAKRQRIAEPEAVVDEMVIVDE